MAGKIKNMIDTIISKRANGNPTIETVTRTKLILKGINTNNYTEHLQMMKKLSKS